MELQKIFKTSYMEFLRNNIVVDNYQKDEFPYDPSQVRMLANVYKPEGLLDRLDPDPKNDLQTAIEIYKAYRTISPLQASLPDLWVYLTHVDLFSYVKKRWPGADSDKDPVKYIINHWHKHSTHFLRTTFAGLWWNVYLTEDPDRKDPFELTKVMYDCGQDWRIMRFGELSLIRRKEAMIGVLEFLKDNPEITENYFAARGQYISRYFNMLGGITNFSYQDRSYFKRKLESIRDRLLQIQSVDEIHHHDVNLGD